MRWPLVGVGIRTSPCYTWWDATSVLLGLHVALVVVAVGADGAARVEPGRRVLERETHVNELLLDFFDRLGAEVPYVEQILLATADELAHRVDALALEAVVRAHGEVEVLDRQRQVGRQGGVGRRRADVDALGVDVELPGQAEQLDQRLARARHRVPRPHARLGLDVEDEPVEGGPLLDAGGLDLVGDAPNRRVDGVDRRPADLLAGLLVLGSRDVAATALDGELHLQLALGVQGGDVQLGVVHLDAGRRRDVGRGHLTGALLAQVHHDRLVVLRGHHEFLQVQDDVGDILLHPRNGGELVQDALDPDAGDGRARNRGQERAPERVADGVAEARLQRLDDEPGPELVYLLLGERGALSDEHFCSLPRRPLYDVAVFSPGGDPPVTPRLG